MFNSILCSVADPCALPVPYLIKKAGQKPRIEKTQTSNSLTWQLSFYGLP